MVSNVPRSTGNPKNFDSKESARLLAVLRKEPSLPSRIERASAYFVGRPYAINPLGGGAEGKEVLTISLASFDCVTYVETVLAFAAARTVKQVIEAVRALRYAKAEVSWPTRNHYMVDWVRNNVGRGVMKNLTVGREVIERQRLLNVVCGLPEKRITLRCFPKRAFKRQAAKMETGEVIIFASTKKNLDVFHMGLIILRQEELYLRHASRRAGRVIEQRLTDFLQENRMSGFMLMRATPNTELLNKMRNRC